MKKRSNKIIAKTEKGSIIVFVSFVLLAIALICISFWKLLRMNTQMIAMKENKIAVYYLARGGIEDALFEIKNNAWGIPDKMTPTWHKVSQNTYQKSPKLGFSYPVSFKATVETQKKTAPITITCQAKINRNNLSFTKILKAKATHSLSNKIHIVSIQENTKE